MTDLKDEARLITEHLNDYMKKAFEVGEKDYQKHGIISVVIAYEFPHLVQRLQDLLLQHQSLSHEEAEPKGTTHSDDDWDEDDDDSEPE